MAYCPTYHYYVLSFTLDVENYSFPNNTNLEPIYIFKGEGGGGGGGLDCDIYDCLTSLEPSLCLCGHLKHGNLQK